MARKTTPAPPAVAQLTLLQMRAAIPKLERRVADLRAVNVASLTEETYSDVLEDLRRRIDDTLVDVFGHDTVDYRRYTIGDLDETPLIIFGGSPPLDQRRPAITSGIASAVSSLASAISILKERLEDSGEDASARRAGPGYLNRFSASISGASAGVRLPSGVAAG